MNAQFGPAITYVLQNEKGYVNDAADPGGETNFGITKRQYPNLDIKNLTREQAIAIYERDFWKFGDFSSQRIATKMLDIFVNMPPARAIKLLQLSLRSILAGPVVADGILGSHTIAFANAADEQALLDELKFQLVKNYLQEALAAPSETKFLDGWLRRAVKG